MYAPLDLRFVIANHHRIPPQQKASAMKTAGQTKKTRHAASLQF
jgi:hypothetical protein